MSDAGAVFAANLAGWISEPYVQDVVVQMLVEAEDVSLVLRDFVCTGGLPIASANRVLLRLHDKRLVTRFKLPVERHIYSHKIKACTHYGARRRVWAYRWVGGRTPQPL